MLHEPDIKAMIRLLGEVSLSPGDLIQKKRFLLTGLCELIDADLWQWTLERYAGHQKEAACLDLMSGNSTASQLAIKVNGHSGIALDASASQPDKDRHLTFTVRQISNDTISTISMVRNPGRRPFSPREVKIAQIILSEISWLHVQSSTPEEKPFGAILTPRQRATLIYLTDGLGRDAIAEKLKISPHTVHGYIKDIYRLYRVNSRASLLKQFSALRKESLPA
jgi:DNA-binding CsgD family transcriptional regulator